MEAFNDAKNAMDELLSQINNIITMSANGRIQKPVAHKLIVAVVVRVVVVAIKINLNYV